MAAASKSKRNVTTQRGKPRVAAPKGAAKATGKAAAEPRGARAAAPAGRTEDGEEPARSNPLGLEIDADVLEFIAALDQFKRDHARPFPGWSEVLHIVKQLGYRKG